MPIWGVIPAAGYGLRMMSEVPKQYMAVHGESMLLRSIRTLMSNPVVDGVVVVLAPDDSGFNDLPGDIQSQVVIATGGETRSDSVAAGVKALIEHAGLDAWALVHDAARPLLSSRDLVNLVSLVTQSEAGGGLLATPVSDTLKRAQENDCVAATIDRAQLWQAQTPQMFKAGPLLSAINQAQQDGVALTDEASAMEHTGMTPLMVAAMDPNFKVTRAADLDLASAWLAQHNEGNR